VVGLNVKQLYAVTFGLGFACIGAAGTLMATIADASPGLGPAYTLLAFVIVIIGGLGSMAGALIGGVLIGISEALAGFYIQPSMKSMFSFALLILVLVLRRRPDGATPMTRSGTTSPRAEKSSAPFCWRRRSPRR